MTRGFKTDAKISEIQKFYFEILRKFSKGKRYKGQFK